MLEEAIPPLDHLGVVRHELLVVEDLQSVTNVSATGVSISAHAAQ